MVLPLCLVNTWCGMLHVWTLLLRHINLWQFMQRGMWQQVLRAGRRRSTVICLTHTFFVPVAIETAGVYGPRTLVFLKELGRRLSNRSGEKRERAYLFQRLSMTVQQGNAISIMGSLNSHLSHWPFYNKNNALFLIIILSRKKKSCHTTF